MKVEDEADKILQRYGAQLVGETERFLTEGMENTELLEPMRYLLATRRDHLHPAIVFLSCEATRGDTMGVSYVSIAISLACHSMVVFDDLLDRTSIKRFVPTLPEKFGSDRALLVAALVAAKAFYALSALAGKVTSRTFSNANTDFQQFLSRMAIAEVKNSNLAKRFALDPEERLALLELESVDVETSARLGAVVGECAVDDVERLTEYGRHLGKAIRLREDLECSLNLTLELADKIRRGAFPYPLAWALAKLRRSESLPTEIKETGNVKADDIQRIIALLFDSGAVAQTSHLIKESSRRSISALSEIEDGKAKDALLTLASAQERLLLRSLRPPP